MFSVYEKSLYNYVIKPVAFIFVIICAIFASNQEQVVAILIGFNLFAIVFCAIKYKKLNYRLWAIFCFVMLFSLAISRFEDYKDNITTYGNILFVLSKVVLYRLFIYNDYYVYDTVLSINVR